MALLLGLGGSDKVEEMPWDSESDLDLLVYLGKRLRTGLWGLACEGGESAAVRIGPAGSSMKPLS